MTQAVASPQTAAVHDALTLPATTAPTAALRAALLRAARITPTRSSNRLACTALLRSVGGVLTVTSANNDLAWCEQITAPNLGDFVIAVRAADLARVAGWLAEDETPLGLRADGKLEIYAAAAETLFAFEGQDAEQHPAAAAFGAIPSSPRYTLPAYELAEAMQHVAYAASEDTFQAVFRGIYFSSKRGLNEVVASDGFRLAMYAVSAPLPEAIIPASSARLLIAAFGGKPSEVNAELVVTLGPSQKDYPAQSLHITAGPHQVQLRCMDGQYPDYGRVLFSEGVHALWSRAPLIKRLKAIRAVSDGYSNHHVKLAQTGLTLSLETSANDEGTEARTTLGLDEPLSGVVSSVSAFYNAGYLLDAVQNAPRTDLKVLIRHDGKATTSSGNRFIDIQSGPYRALLAALRT